MRSENVNTDILIIGGGTAGCFAARFLGAYPDIDVLVVDKAAIKRSGCLAAGVNAINAYITRGKTPEFYADYAFQDAGGIARYDLLISMARRLNAATAALEQEGVVFQKDEFGNYAERGPRNVRINGENIKPVLASSARRQPNVRVLEHVNVTSLVVQDGRVRGAVGFGTRTCVAYLIHARAVIVASGGAAGLYRPNNPGFSAHKMWYCPFNTGAGYAMGIRAGAEMTSLEMRFIALRCKDTIAPTGTIAQGVGAKQINAAGEIYEDRYGLSTSERVWGTVEENRQGRGPCYLHTTGISAAARDDLYRAYLNMAPAQTLRWVESGAGPDVADVEIEGTEPYIVGGHTASGYWIDASRATTIPGLFAAGDVAGGAPQKYVSGALVEGEIAAESAVLYLEGLAGAASLKQPDESLWLEALLEYEAHFNANPQSLNADELEVAMQQTMDTYAGGISCAYRYNQAGLDVALEKIAEIHEAARSLPAPNIRELLRIYELLDRLVVCRSLIAHLGARKETRWHSFAENTDFPQINPAFEKYVNSRLIDGKIQIFLRDIVHKGQDLEASHLLSKAQEKVHI